MTTIHPLVAQYLKERIGLGRLSRSSARHVRYPLLSFAAAHGDRPVHHIGPTTVDRWLMSCAHLAPATRRNYLSIVRGFCRWLQRQGKIKGDPTAHLEPIRQPRPVPRCLSEVQIAALIASLPDLRAEVVIWLMVGCGVRCIEIARLGIGDYDPHGLTLRLTGKGGHVRVIPVPTEVASVLDRYISSTRANAGPLLRSLKHTHQGITAGTLSQYVSRWMAEAQVKRGAHDGISAHSLRHTCATDVYRRSLNLAAVQAMLGHANIATTSRYLGPTNIEELRDAMGGRDYRAPHANVFELGRQRSDERRAA